MGMRRSLSLLALVSPPLLGMVSTAPARSTARGREPQRRRSRSPRPVVELPNRPGSFKFAVIGDFGNGDRAAVPSSAQQMAKLRARFPFELVITVGDNIYGGDRPQDMQRKFELPYKALLDGGREVLRLARQPRRPRAAARYALFNMDGRTVLHVQGADGGRPLLRARDRPTWTRTRSSGSRRSSTNSNEDWKIPYFHHPLYSSAGGTARTSNLAGGARAAVPQANVSVVFSGHDHFYERIKPQNGIVYFVVGSGGQLRKGDINAPAPALTAVGFDTDQAFLVAEIDGDQLYFNAISRLGTVIDSGVIERRKPE